MAACELLFDVAVNRKIHVCFTAVGELAILQLPSPNIAEHIS